MVEIGHSAHRIDDDEGRYRMVRRVLGRMSRVHVFIAMLMHATVVEAEQTTKPTSKALALEVSVSSSRATVSVILDQRLPFRTRLLADPKRFLLDLDGLDWSEVIAPVLPEGNLVSGLRIGRIAGDWARLVLDLEQPMQLTSAGYAQDDDRLEIRLVLEATDEATYQAIATAAVPPPNQVPGQDPATILIKPAVRAPDAKPLIMIDPGHGGIDPGAVYGEITEKTLNLDFARTLASVLEASDRFDTALTRSDDRYLLLKQRVAMAIDAGADVFLSIHVNTVEVGRATGLSLYSLSDKASDQAARKMAEFENRADTLAGFDVTTESGVVAMVLVDIAQRETNARSRQLADELVSALGTGGTILRTRPHRRAGFMVLKSPAIPSILLELGFMSSEEDRSRLSDPDWKNQTAKGILDALDAWVEADRTRQNVSRR